jgi:hypothetical protein
MNNVILRNQLTYIIILALALLPLFLILCCGVGKQQTAEEFGRDFVELVDAIDSNALLNKYFMDMNTVRYLEETIPETKGISEEAEGAIERNHKQLKYLLKGLVEERKRVEKLKIEFVSIDLGEEKVYAENVIEYRNAVINLKIIYDDNDEVDKINIYYLAKINGEWKIAEFDWYNW